MTAWSLVLRAFSKGVSGGPFASGAYGDGFNTQNQLKNALF